ncbi:MAG: hypothetical protein Q4C03_08165, partial [bacterium]|nr:hypothetical protein [bacterium]
HAAAYQVEVLDGATFQVGTWAGAITSTDAEITLRAGGRLALYNGNATHGSTVVAKIVVDSTAEKPAIIAGGAYGDNAKITGTISGKGVLQLDALTGNTFMIEGVIADASTTETLKVLVTTANGVTLSGTNTYTGGTEIAAGSILRVGSMANLGASGDVVVMAGGTLNVHTAANTQDHGDAWNRVKGNGTISYTAAGATWHTLPTLATAFATTLTVDNNLSEGIILPEPAANYVIGSVSGSGSFRWDYSTVSGDSRPKTLTILQSKNTTYTGKLAYSADARLTKFILQGSGDSKTLTLTGTETAAKPMDISASGALNLSGSWAGAMTVSGSLGGSGTVGGALTYNNNATIDMTSGAALTANGTVVVPADAVTVVLGEVVASDLQLIKATSITTDMPMATVKIGDEVITTVQLEKRSDGLYLPMKQIFTRTFDGTATTWEATDAWGIKDSTADIPLSGATIELTMGGKDTVVSHDEKIHVGAVDFVDEGHLILEFDLSAMMDDDDYLASPYTVQLLEIDEGVDAE